MDDYKDDVQFGTCVYCHKKVARRSKRAHENCCTKNNKFRIVNKQGGQKKKPPCFLVESTSILADTHDAQVTNTLREIIVS